MFTLSRRFAQFRLIVALAVLAGMSSCARSGDSTPGSDLAPEGGTHPADLARAEDPRSDRSERGSSLADLPSIPPPPTSKEWSQHAHDAMHTSYAPQSVLPPWTFRWVWNGSDSAGKISQGKTSLPRNVQVVSGGGLAYLAAGARGLFALDLATGKEVWSQKGVGTINSTPAYDGATGALFALSTQGTLFKLAATQGGSIQGQFATGASSNLPLPPVVHGKRVFFSMGNSVYALDTTSMKPVWTYDAKKPVHTPPAYSPSRDRVVAVSEDLFVHAINGADGSPVWKTKPTVRTGGEPTDGTKAEVKYGWPVISESHGYVLIKYRLDWATMTCFPTTNSGIRAYLTAKKADQALFVLSLEDGHVPFIANIGHGGYGDGGYMPMGPQPALKRLASGKEVVWTVIRGDTCPPDGKDGRWDSWAGEMVLDDQTVSGLSGGEVRWIESVFTNGSLFFPTDEQPNPSVAGDYLFFGHWEAGAVFKIADRSPNLGSYQKPIATEFGPAVATSQDDSSCALSPSHYCAAGLQNTRSYPPGFYIYYKQGAVYDQYWREYAAFSISNDMVFFASCDGAVIALQGKLGQAGMSTPPPPAVHGLRERAAGGRDDLFPRAEPVDLEQAESWPRVDWRLLHRHAGQDVRVRFTVRYVFNNRVRVLLAARHPHQGFAKALIPRHHWPSFGGAPERLFRTGDEVEVRGRVVWYQGDPVIYVRDGRAISKLR
jgi:outer membrane protein assembly factor BamB